MEKAQLTQAGIDWYLEFYKKSEGLPPVTVTSEMIFNVTSREGNRTYLITEDYKAVGWFNNDMIVVK